jgi:hypothetical protein
MPAIEALLNCRGRGPLLQRMAVMQRAESTDKNRMCKRSNRLFITVHDRTLKSPGSPGCE